MTTSLRNVGFQEEIRLFLKTKQPSTPIAAVYAFADCLIAGGSAWLQSDEAKALLHSLNMSVHGPGYKINGTQEQKRLEELFLAGT